MTNRRPGVNRRQQRMVQNRRVSNAGPRVPHDRRRLSHLYRKWNMATPRHRLRFDPFLELDLPRVSSRRMPRRGGMRFPVHPLF